VSAEAARKATRRASAARSRVPLTRETVLRAGLEVANKEGIDAVTLRRIADGLSVTPMALYRHVSSKSDLLAGMLDLVVRDAAVTDHNDDDWRAWTCRTFARMAEAMLQQPGVMALVGRVGSLGSATLPVLEKILSRLCAVGFSPSEAAHLQEDLNRFMLGSVALEGALGGDPSNADRERHLRARLELLPSKEFPALTAHAAEVARSLTSRDFETGLRRIIDSHAETLSGRPVG